MSNPTAFLTGSQVYGILHKNSDVDLVVFMDPVEAQDLLQAMGAWSEAREGYRGTEVLQFKAGKLNVLIVQDEEALEAWRLGTEQLVDEALALRALKVESGVTRERAVEVFKERRADAKIKRSERKEIAKVFEL